MPNTADAILIDATGPVFVERGDTSIELNKGDSIHESDVIITGANTTANIEFTDGTISRLAPNTKLKLNDYEFETSEPPSFVMELVQGALHTATGEVVTLNPDAFEVVTPSATVGIRGTTFVVTVDENVVFVGSLNITEGKEIVITGSDGQSINLTSALQGVSIDGPTPLAVRDFSMPEMVKLLQNIDPSFNEGVQD